MIKNKYITNTSYLIVIAIISISLFACNNENNQKPEEKIQKPALIQIGALIIGTVLLAAFYFYCTELSTGLDPLWNEILRQNQLN